MKTIQTIINVCRDGFGIVRVPDDLPPGQYVVVVVIDSPPPPKAIEPRLQPRVQPRIRAVRALPVLPRHDAPPHHGAPPRAELAKDLFIPLPDSPPHASRDDHAHPDNRASATGYP